MFSIIIPLYNKSHTIKRALKSIINQTYKNFEIIIVDDGSTDNGIEIVNKFTSDVRIKILKHKNQGVSIARNNGVKNSLYEYIAFLDADDEWEPKYLETIFGVIKIYPECGMICCARYIKDEINKKKKLIMPNKYKGRFIEINYFENPHVFSHTSSTVVEKKTFIKVGGFPEAMKKNEDFALFFSIALNKSTIYCGFPLSYYYINVEGQSTSVNKTNFYESNLNVCERFNLTYSLWNKIGRTNKTFKIFLKYEFRHIMLDALKRNDFDTIKLFLENIDNNILKLFPWLELKLYGIPSLKIINKLYIYLTKMLWRTRGYPIAGK